MKNKKPGRHRPRGLEILYEDRDLLVVNKEPGVLTTATRRGETFTAEEVLSDYLRKGCARSTKRVFLVHRLDRETSGVLLFAKSGEAQQRLKEAWPTTEKFYLAVVRGRMSVPQAVLTSYLAERDDLFVVPVADPSQGKRSQTAYTVIKATPALTFVKIRLLTGRRNQIRVQFADRGFPLLGDQVYGQKSELLDRQALHAEVLGFRHPVTDEQVTVMSPLPKDMEAALKALRTFRRVERAEAGIQGEEGIYKPKITNARKFDRVQRAQRFTGEKTEEGRSERPERNERPVRSARPERAERPVRTERPERPERGARPAGGRPTGGRPQATPGARPGSRPAPRTAAAPKGRPKPTTRSAKGPGVRNKRPKS